MSKLKVNIIIPSRGRLEYLKICLLNLNEANKLNEYNIVVYIVYDRDFYINSIDKLLNLSIELIKYPKHYEQFCRAKLLNYGLLIMRKDFNIVSIIDNDMIYNDKFFETLNNDVKDNVYFISSGYKLKRQIDLLQNKVLYKNIFDGMVDEEFKHENHHKLYPSQISLTRNTYHKLLSILSSNKLYNDDFIGWGGEDSVLSSLSNRCHLLNIITKKINYNMWFHLWHERFGNGFDNEQYRKNVALMKRLVNKNAKKDILTLIR